MRTPRQPVLYKDRWIECTTQALIIHGYYFPFGKKTIAYDRINNVYQYEMGSLTGKGRIWGSGDFKHWWHLDPGRPHKEQALLLDLGKFVVPVITPDDPTQVKAIIESGQSQRSAGRPS